MALPTLRPYHLSARGSSNISSKSVAEKLMVQRRQQDEQFRQEWSENSRNFRRYDLNSSKQSQWFEQNQYLPQSEKVDKQKDLQLRRLKLARLLQEDRDQHEAELKGIREYNKDNRIFRMKERSESLKSAREQTRREIAEQKLVEHWRQNCPELREVSQRQHKRYVVNNWSNQVDERKKIEEELNNKEREFAEKYERERLRGLRKEKEAAEKKRIEDQKLAEALANQVKELRAKEEESKSMNALQDKLMQEQWELDKLEEERKLMLEQRKKVELGRFLTRQYRTQMKRRCQQIQEELQMDIQLLNALIESEAQQQALQSARKEKARADAAWMKQVMEEQMRLEKAREAEMEMLYREEASRMWQKREEEWEKERLARERLMAEVLSDRQKQIREKMDVIKQQQMVALEEREQLVKRLEMHNIMTAREEQQQKELQSTRMTEIKDQITSRRDQIERDKETELETLKEEAAAEEMYKDVLRDEIKRLKIRDYDSNVHHKRKTAWD